MIEIKYYYSKPTHIRHLPVFTDAKGDVIAICETLASKRVKTLPRITVASVYDTDTRTMTFGVSVCSPKDQFVKEVGRQLAKERALTKPANTVVAIRRSRIRETSKRYANELIANCLKRYVRFGI